MSDGIDNPSESWFERRRRDLATDRLITERVLRDVRESYGKRPAPSSAAPIERQPAGKSRHHPARRNRGLYEEATAFPGSRVFTLVAKDGQPLMQVTVRAEKVTRAFVANLWRWLDREDPPVTLSLVQE